MLSAQTLALRWQGQRDTRMTQQGLQIEANMASANLMAGERGQDQSEGPRVRLLAQLPAHKCTIEATQPAPAYPLIERRQQLIERQTLGSE